MTATNNTFNLAQRKQGRFVEVGQAAYLKLLEGYHNTLHTADTYGELEENSATYAMFAEMAFAAAEEFAKAFEHQEP